MKTMKSTPGPDARIGVDENGLGARLGPLIVTATLADVSEKGVGQLTRKLPPTLRADLDDSKALVSCHDVSLGEAWARAVVERTQGEAPRTPSQLFSSLSRQTTRALTKDCPAESKGQCWSHRQERFTATEEQLNRVRKHLDALCRRGIEIKGVLTDVTCTARLNTLKRAGIHRFTADLHAMERLVLALAKQAQRPIVATCGKVGGIGQYSRFFGPLAGYLHTPLVEGQAESRYHFPDLGELRFVRDADATDPLVMLASLVGKYVRELLMGRIARHYSDLLSDDIARPSGYHDPVSARFVAATAERRSELGVVPDCFEREPAKPKRQPASKEKSTKGSSARGRAGSRSPKKQGSLF